jgi:type I restriction enzyme, S subunit
MTIDTSTKLQTKTVAYTLTQNNKGLPDGWRWLKLGDAAKFIDYRGKTPKKTNSGIPLITAKNVKMGFINEEPREFIAEKDYKSWMTRGFPKVGDVLFTTEAPLGNVAQLKTNDRIALAQRMITFQSYEFLNSTFLKYNLQSPQFQKLLNSKGTGTTVKGIKASVLKQLEIPLPSITEQHSIVSKIEELLSELDKGKQQLETAQQQLKIYRQAVLKWAFEGKLTNENVKEGELPVSWKNVKLGDVSSLITKGASPKWQGINYVDDSSQVLFVTSENIRENYIDISKPKYLELAFNEKQKRSILKKGDILLNIVGASIGRAAVYDLELNANINQAVSVIRLNNTILKKYVSYFLNSNTALGYYNLNKVDFARANLSLADVSNIPLGLPPLDEQTLVIQEIESRLSVCDKVEETITNSLAQAETLRQSILKKAFEGKLI